MYQNRLSLIGFSGKEAEQKFTNNGTAYAVLSLATKTSWKNDNDEWESRTKRHRIVAWSKLGEFALTLKKGAHLQVEGELRSREYEKNGVKRRIWECRRTASPSWIASSAPTTTAAPKRLLTTAHLFSAR